MAQKPPLLKSNHVPMITSPFSQEGPSPRSSPTAVPLWCEPYIPNMRARESFRPRVSFGRVERTSGYYPGKARYGQVMAKGQLGPISHHRGRGGPWRWSLLGTTDGIYSKEDIDLISTGISLQRGRIPAANIIQVDKWLKAASKQDKRALRVVNDGG